jgi:hypothetical protein
MNLIHGSATPPCCLRIVLEMWLPGTSPDMTWNDLRAPNKAYDTPSAFNASYTFGRAFMRPCGRQGTGGGKMPRGCASRMRRTDGTFSRRHLVNDQRGLRLVTLV